MEYVFLMSNDTIEVAALDVPATVQSDVRPIRQPAIDGIKVNMSVEVGRIEMPIKELRAARQGTVITLDRMVGDSLDVRVNGKLIARGEIVATEGRRYGIRITEIVVPEDEDGKTL
jgi:flagellar motor switch protein FliN/FliY